ncbi:NAD(P)-dependent oxidoreductase [Variovorax sp. HJSM1_2]|uniref:NAD(P)-dependent oxidoreductase n=1 Tax=Variovorax sp. HJSM1_2 TaxID=3366263 RepID=UPI003BE623BB
MTTAASVFVTHPANRLDQYFGAKATQALRNVAEVRFNPYERDLSAEELVQLACDCEFIIAYRQTAADAALFAALPKLLAMLRCAVDIRTINVPAASAHGVLITQASAGFMASVSEWIFGALIDLCRNIGGASGEYHAGLTPVPRMGRELRGATLGLIGYGQISRYSAKLAHAFGMQVLVTDPYADLSAEPGITACSLPQLLQQADHVVCLAPANSDTENLMNTQAFAQMRQGATFINASRGNLVDETALLAALDSGQLSGCALDVGRAPDQMPSPALARHPLVVATPHIGGLTPPAIEHQAIETATQVQALLRGEMPLGAVNAADAKRLAAWRKGLPS